MNGILADTLAWWRGGDLLMPVMCLIAVVLYVLLAERSLALWAVRRRARHEAIVVAVNAVRLGERDEHRVAWAVRSLGLAEAEQLARGVAICRALTACLPLLGLLGTVSGMIETFGSLGANAQRAGAGIGLALTATQYGMALAIPALLWDWLLNGRAAQLAEHREQAVRQALATP